MPVVPERLILQRMHNTTLLVGEAPLVKMERALWAIPRYLQFASAVRRVARPALTAALAVMVHIITRERVETKLSSPVMVASPVAVVAADMTTEQIRRARAVAEK
jgi:hypothetical protein